MRREQRWLYGKPKVMAITIRVFSPPACPNQIQEYRNNQDKNKNRKYTHKRRFETKLAHFSNSRAHKQEREKRKQMDLVVTHVYNSTFCARCKLSQVCCYFKIKTQKKKKQKKVSLFSK